MQSNQAKEQTMSTFRIVRWILTTMLVLSILFTGGPAMARASIPGVDDVPQAVLGSTAEPAMSSEIVVSALNNEKVRPAVAYNAKHGEYLVVWQNIWPGNSDIYGQRIGEDGQLRSWFAISAGSNDRVQPAVAYDPDHDRYLVTWVHDVSGNGSNWDVRGRIVPWDGPSQALTEFVICDWPTTQWNPEIAYGRSQDEFLVVWWTDHPSVPDYVSGRRINATTGVPADTPFAIAHQPSHKRILPDVAYNLSRNEYLVTYHDDQDIWGTRLQGNGNILGGGEFGIAGWPSAEIEPVVASCDREDQYLVVWQSLQSGTHYDIYARFITGSGTPDTVHHIFGDPVHQVAADVTCVSNGSLYIVTWQNQFSTITGPYGILGRMISSEKRMGDAFTLMSPTAGIQAEFTRPATAGGRAQFLTAWEHERAGTAYQDIHARLATPFSLYIPFVQR
jgi:hypothetical protein